MLVSCAVEQAAGGRPSLHPQAGLIREQEGEQSKQGAQGLPPSTPCDASPGRQERLVQYRQSGATLPQPPPPPAGGGCRTVGGCYLGCVWRGPALPRSPFIPDNTSLNFTSSFCHSLLPISSPRLDFMADL